MFFIIIAGILFLIIVFIKMIIISRDKNNRNKKNNELMFRFNELTERNNLSFTHKEMIGNYIIGLDELRKKLFVLSRPDNMYSLQIINLKEIKNCSSNKLYMSINMEVAKNPAHEVLPDKIVLEINYLNNRKPTQFPFYVSGLNQLREMRELEQKAKGWEVILTKEISNRIKVAA
jgi:hypothetical protein